MSSRGHNAKLLSMAQLQLVGHTMTGPGFASVWGMASVPTALENPARIACKVKINVTEND